MIRAQMAKWLRDYLSFGSRRPPPQPPTPDYTESDILRAYRVQKNLDFEDPYEDSDSRPEPDPASPGDSKFHSPKHRLIKVEAADMARAKALLDNPGEEVRAWAALGTQGAGRWVRGQALLPRSRERGCCTIQAWAGHQILPAPHLPTEFEASFRYRVLAVLQAGDRQPCLVFLPPAQNPLL